MPTKWVAAAATAVFLAATAAFGGLAPVKAVAIPEIDAGEQFTSDQFAITVERALLIDEFKEAGAYADQDKDERVLALQVEVENLWTEPQPSTGKGALAGVVRVNDLEHAGSVARYDDATKSPLLQPGVPASVVLTWVIDGDDFAEGDEITVTLNNMTLYTASFVASGQWWNDPTPAVTVPLVLTDVGAGAEAEQ